MATIRFELMAAWSLGRRLPLAAGLILALHLAKAAFLFSDGQPPLYQDTQYYWESAAAARSGDWLLLEEPNAYRTPAYSWFLVVPQALFGNRALVAAAVIQHLLVILSALLVAAVSAHLLRSPGVLLLGLLVALPAVARHRLASYMYADNLLAFEVALLAVLVALWMSHPSATVSVAMGLFLGLGILTKPALQLAWVPLLASMGHRLWATARGAALRGTLKHGALLLIATLTVISPWLLRNQLAFGELFITRLTGRALWMSAFAESTAKLPLPSGPDSERLQRLARLEDSPTRRAWVVHGRLQRAGLSELEADGLMRDASWESIRGHPSRFAGSVAQRMLRYWSTPGGTGAWREIYYVARGKGTYLDQKPWPPVTRSSQQEELGGAASFKESEEEDETAGVALGSLVALVASCGGLVVLVRRRRFRSLAIALALLGLYLTAVVAGLVRPSYRFRVVVEPLSQMIVTLSAGSLLKVWLARGRGTIAG